MDTILATNTGYTIAVIIAIVAGVLIGTIWAKNRSTGDKKRLSIGVSIFVAASFIADAIYFIMRN